MLSRHRRTERRPGVGGAVRNTERPERRRECQIQSQMEMNRDSDGKKVEASVAQLGFQKGRRGCLSD